MDKEKRKALRRGGMEAMERLDLPENIVPRTPRMELVGNRSFYMDRHQGVISYATDVVDIAGGSVVVRLFGEGLEILVMTDDELRIEGHIDRVELVE